MKDILETSSITLPLCNYASYLQYVLPQNAEMSERCKSLQNLICTRGHGLRDEKLRAFVTHLFPPLLMCFDSQEFAKHDVIPQFGVENEGKKFSFHCYTCSVYEKVCEKKRSRSVGKKFEGISQLYQHGISKFHTEGIHVLSGSKDMPAKPIGGNINLMDRYLQTQTMTVKCENITDP
jgi:hypothetical protein